MRSSEISQPARADPASNITSSPIILMMRPSCRPTRSTAAASKCVTADASALSSRDCVMAVKPTRSANPITEDPGSPVPAWTVARFASATRWRRNT
jgi:hypothetical protein